jgi:hypothetical protein
MPATYGTACCPVIGADRRSPDPGPHRRLDSGHDARGARGTQMILSASRCALHAGAGRHDLRSSIGGHLVVTIGRSLFLPRSRVSGLYRQEFALTCTTANDESCLIVTSPASQRSSQGDSCTRPALRLNGEEGKTAGRALTNAACPWARRTASRRGRQPAPPPAAETYRCEGH